MSSESRESTAALVPSPQEPRWAPIDKASDYGGVPRSTLRRWAAKGIIPACRVGPRKIHVDLNALDQMRKPATPARWLTEADEQLAREVAAALLPLADWQKEKLSLLLNPGRGRHDTGS
jgi:excisionase family DNA binding protein